MKVSFIRVHSPHERPSKAGIEYPSFHVGTPYLHDIYVCHLGAHIAPPPALSYLLVLYTRSASTKEVITAWDNGIGRLIDAGVTGRILLANMPSPKGVFVSPMLDSAEAEGSQAFQDIRVGLPHADGKK